LQTCRTAARFVFRAISAAAYNLMRKRIIDFVDSNQVGRVVIKASAVPTPPRANKSLLEGAELRGAVMSCAGENIEVVMINKAVLSRLFGERRADDYIRDDGFWDDVIDGNLRKKSREVALMLLHDRDQQ
jgi:hypothetical protein